MSISNINYVVRLVEQERPLSELDFRLDSPQMFIKKCLDFTLLIFASGAARIMGCKTPIDKGIKIHVDGVGLIQIERMQSASASFNVGHRLNLSKFGNFCHDQRIPYIFEPELFPALRLTAFDPICLNIFSTGKCTILGLRHLCYQKYIRRVLYFINRSECIEVECVNDNDSKLINEEVIRLSGIREDGATAIQCHKGEAQGLSKTQRGDGCNQQQQQPEDHETSKGTKTKRKWSETAQGEARAATQQKEVGGSKAAAAAGKSKKHKKVDKVINL